MRVIFHPFPLVLKSDVRTDVTDPWMNPEWMNSSLLCDLDEGQITFWQMYTADKSADKCCWPPHFATGVVHICLAVVLGRRSSASSGRGLAVRARMNTIRHLWETEPGPFIPLPFHTRSLPSSLPFTFNFLTWQHHDAVSHLLEDSPGVRMCQSLWVRRGRNSELHCHCSSINVVLHKYANDGY